METQIDADRRFYVNLRKDTGCPPVVLINLENLGYGVETKDGSVYMECVNAPSSWDAKSQCVEEWVRQQDLKQSDANLTEDKQ